MPKHIKLSLLIVVVFATLAFAAGRGDVFVTKTSRNDGNAISPVYVSCSSTTWTTLLATSPTRRVAKLITRSGALEVCLSTNTTTTSICDATRPSYRLMATIPFEHASEAYVMCRTTDNASTAIVYGFDYTDSGDAGDAAN